LVFLSSAGKMIGNMTLLFCLIKLSIWSLFHKNNARSATWTEINAVSCRSSISYIFCICNITRTYCTIMQKLKQCLKSQAPKHNCGLRCDEGQSHNILFPKLHNIFLRIDQIQPRIEDSELLFRM
jgi:hypothetical protein